MRSPHLAMAGFERGLAMAAAAARRPRSASVANVSSINPSKVVEPGADFVAPAASAAQVLFVQRQRLLAFPALVISDSQVERGGRRPVAHGTRRFEFPLRVGH